MPPYWNDPYHQGVCVEIEADMESTLTKITEAAASFLSLRCVCVCENRCVLFMVQGYFRGGGPSSRPRCIGPFIAPLSIFIATLLSSPIIDQLAVTGVSLHQSHASLCGNIPTSHPFHPTLYNGFFFLLWRSGWEKKGGRGWRTRRRRRVAATTGRVLPTAAAKSIDSLGSGCRASVVNGSLRLTKGGWVEDEMMGGRGWRRTGGGCSRDGLK